MESPPVQDRRLVEAREDLILSDDPPASEKSRLQDGSSEAEQHVPPEPQKAALPEVSDPQRQLEPDSSIPEVSSRLCAVDDSPVESKPADRTSDSAVTDGGPQDPKSSISDQPQPIEPIEPIGDTDRAIADRSSEEIFFTDCVTPAESSSDPTSSRKRPAADFLPITAEIKRIGVEISDEQAQQLKNDVRRLSPILVSLRERTLGEISLTSDSGLYEDETQPPRSPLENVIAQAADFSSLIPIDAANVATKLEESSKDKSDASLPVEAPIGMESALTEGSMEVPTARQPSQFSENIEEPSKHPTDLVIQEIGNCSSPISSPQSTDRGQRELVIVLSRVDDNADSKVRSRIDVADSETGRDVAGAGQVHDADAPINDTNRGALGNPETTSGAQQDDKSASIVSGGRENPLPVEGYCLSPKYLGNDQLSRKSPMVVIERTLNSPTIGSRSATENDRAAPTNRPNLDRVRKTLADSMIGNDDEDLPIDRLPAGDDCIRSVSPTGLAETTSDLQESPDTETETETVSDSSELTSINSINLSDCVEPASGLSCPDTDSLPSEEATEGILTRLEPERPEAFTEDSAESLALATGARDEVRSDGSDSGLGSEIPGDTGPAPAPESDSETSFLDRIPDDILTDKDKAVNQAEAFVPDAGTSGIQQPHQQQQQQQQQEQQLQPQQQQQQVRFPTLPSPTKSSLKRRLTDCMEGEPSPKRINTDDPLRKKRNIQFDAVTVYYFPRAQGFTCVPSQGGSTLGMSATHTHAERFSLAEHATEQRRIHRARLAQLRSERAANCVTEAASSSEDPSDDTDEEPSDTEELDIDSYYFLQPVPTWQRRALLRSAGVRRIDAVEKDDCRDIRASREHCGCGCKGYCDPESCPCSRANVKCQVDRAGFPCGCSRDGCANSSGRIEFNPVRVRTHFIHTLMRLQLEKKQRDEDRTEHELLTNQSPLGPMREVASLLANPMDHPGSMSGDPVSCMNAGGFTTLHYDNHDTASTSCQPVVHAREDSLDLYAIRDDCYATETETIGVDGLQNAQRKLHPEFGQAFQTFPVQQQQQQQQPGVGFAQGGYQDYQTYQTLATTSRSQFQPQFQAMTPSASGGFSHYSYGQDASVMQAPCQPHPGNPHHVYDNYQQEDPVGPQQYTNLNSVQPMNAVVQQMGKLEPFSELLAGRYSYYGDVEPQPLAGYQPHNGATRIDDEESQTVDNIDETANDDCDENFGEIIKKSMVETVSA